MQKTDRIREERRECRKQRKAGDNRYNANIPENQEIQERKQKTKRIKREWRELR